MKLFNIEQIQLCDQFTIKHEPISSIELMERAAHECVKFILKNTATDSKFYIFCGKGNNGGDGLAIGRQLIMTGYQVQVFVLAKETELNNDCHINYLKIKEQNANAIINVDSIIQIQECHFESNAYLIDAIFGTGLSKPLDGIYSEVVNLINGINLPIISIDVPSGLYCDKPNQTEDSIIRSSLTLTFQFPKLSFLLSQNQKWVPRFVILDIKLHKDIIDNLSTSHFFIQKSDLKPLLKTRNKFSHKGEFGHALLIAGSYGKMGAATIAASACLKSGSGLLTVHVPSNGVDIIQSTIPEAMVSIDSNEACLTELPNMAKFTAVAIGPGIGTKAITESLVKTLFNFCSLPLIIDADAINILATNPTWLSFIPENSILTPHVKEFDRLTHVHSNDFERLKSAREFAIKNKCILILKGAFTSTCMRDGSIFFNSTGNPGLAKGGSGDTLTGILLGLMARGYNPPQSALIGVFLHGLAADIAIKKIHIESLLATDVINKLPKAFSKLYN